MYPGDTSKQEASYQLNFRIPASLWQAIQQARGDLPMAAYFRQALWSYIHQQREEEQAAPQAADRKKVEQE